jgi:hypothetical protein
MPMVLCARRTRSWVGGCFPPALCPSQEELAQVLGESLSPEEDAAAEEELAILEEEEGLQVGLLQGRRRWGALAAVLGLQPLTYPRAGEARPPVCAVKPPAGGCFGHGCRGSAWRSGWPTNGAAGGARQGGSRSGGAGRGRGGESKPRAGGSAGIEAPMAGGVWGWVRWCACCVCVCVCVFYRAYIRKKRNGDRVSRALGQWKVQEKVCLDVCVKEASHERDMCVCVCVCEGSITRESSTGRAPGSPRTGVNQESMSCVKCVCGRSRQYGAATWRT